MKTKYIFKTLALAMLMPAMLLTTACSNEDDAVNNTENIANKGYALPVTVNVTRQGDEATTRATYNETDKKLEFSEGDKLFVKNYYTGEAGQFAGTLDYDTKTGKFSGTIYTENPYSGTIDALFTAGEPTAYLLPADYKTYGYLAIISEGTYSASFSSDSKNAFATSKATAVEQFSYEYGDYTSGKGFALSPLNAILNFTITGLANNADVDVFFSKGYTISQTLTSDSEGEVTFAVGVYNTDLKDCALTVGGKAITLVNSSKTLASGKIYNITRIIGALSGRFSVSSDKQVYFSQGNLQAVIASGPTDTYNYTASSWKFAENQWDYIGNAAGNNTFAVGSTVDLFGWVGTSASYDTYGLCTQKSTSDAAFGQCYGTNTSDALKSDWGTTIGTGWRTLTSAEWDYLTQTRTSGSTVNGTDNARYAHAEINTDVSSVYGLILFPDGVDIAASEVSTAGIVNLNSAWGTKCTSAQWTALAAKGCVFLPAAGYREGTTVEYAGEKGYYWSSSPYSSNSARNVDFGSSSISWNSTARHRGHSVRLVRDVK